MGQPPPEVDFKAWRPALNANPDQLQERLEPGVVPLTKTFSHHPKVASSARSFVGSAEAGVMTMSVEVDTQVLEKSPYVKVHGSMCNELQKILNVVTELFPHIESAKPGGKSGIEELCSLSSSVEKGKLIIQHCTETSKLYSVITRESTLSRCERVKQAINKSLIHIQCMVPDPLATQIGNILDSLMDVKFIIDVNEDVAGDALLSLLRQSNTDEDLEFTAFQIVTSKLNLLSPKALLIERRCVKQLLEKFRNSDKKEKILTYLMYLIKRYGKKVNEIYKHEEELNGTGTDLLSSSSSSEINPTDKYKAKHSIILNHSGNEPECDLYPDDVPPEEYLCPLSLRLMHDPVIIASGLTYERLSIETWFNEGNDTCPKTEVKLSNLSMIPNYTLKKLIFQWCMERGISFPNPGYPLFPVSVNTSDISNSSSLSSVYNVTTNLLYGDAAKHLFQNSNSNISAVSSDRNFYSDLLSGKFSEKSSKANPPVFPWSDDYTKSQSFASFEYKLYIKFLSDLSELPPIPHHKALEDLNKIFESNSDSCRAMFSNGLTEAIMDFLKEVCGSSNVRAQETGLQVLLAVISNFSFKTPSISDDAVYLLPFFLKSELTLEALKLIKILSQHPGSKPVIVSSVSSLLIDILQHKDSKFVGLILEILVELSSLIDISSLILPSNCLSKLVPVLRDDQYAGACLKILSSLCETVEGGEAVVRADGCIANIAECLDSDDQNERADAIDIFLSLCSRGPRNCSIVMNEGIIPSLVHTSINGNIRGKEGSAKLLHILRDRARNDSIDGKEALVTGKGLAPTPNNQPMEKSTPSRKPRFLSKVTMLFSKKKP